MWGKMMKKAIVTGASGFIGQALVKKLELEGYEVYAVIRDTNKADIFSGFNSIKPIICNLSDIVNLDTLIHGRDFELFFHLAWDGTSGNSREDYDKQLSNVKYTCEAVKIAQKLGCKKFIYAGSLMEYESINYIPISGSKPALNYIYRTAKLSAHYMAKAIAAELGLDFRIGIISNAYGEGELSERLINSTIRKLIKGEKMSFTDGEQLYDFIYITDVAKAFIAIAEEGKPYGNYYIGNKNQRKLKEYLIDIRDCIDKNMELGLGEIAFDGVGLDYTKIDTARLYEDTGFRCEVEFKEGINKTVKWLSGIKR